MKSKLDDLIQPEIKDDSFYDLIKNLIREEKPDKILEIGSSSGEGSTQAFVEGIHETSSNAQLFCLEISKNRYSKLSEKYSKCKFVKCYNYSSVSPTRFLSKEDITLFYKNKKTNLNTYRLETVLSWLDQDIDYIKDNDILEEGIHQIKAENRIMNFDLVLIDGSAFSACAELNEVYGSKNILLDDINDIKNLDNFSRLKKDPYYELKFVDWKTRNGFAYFKRKEWDLSIHFFSIVLSGFPFIKYHLQVLGSLPFEWHWHIVEGVAALKHDTAWSLKNGGNIPHGFHKNGLSIDGTTEYLDKIKTDYPDKITIYRKENGNFWDGKLEMVNAPLKNIDKECLLWEIDVDEFWTRKQMNTLYQLFLKNPDKTAAFFFCTYFVGENLIISSKDTYGNYTSYEWLRVWRYKPGYKWVKHEPPQLFMQDSHGRDIDVASINPFLHKQTKKYGLVFQHYPYFLEKQLEFKEKYYGYKNAVLQWKSLQSETLFPNYLKHYFAWVKDDAIVDTAKSHGIKAIIDKYSPEEWVFRYDDSI